MRTRELAVTGAFEFAPRSYPDQRGVFVSPFQEDAFVAATGHPLFPVAQASASESHRGVLRGLHYTPAPPGTAKYVHCPRGRALDIVVDLRLGSPTFGARDTVELDPGSFRAVYLPPGVGHAFVALEDHTVVAYLLSQRYVAANELALDAMDPELDLPLPPDLDFTRSARDQAAPTAAAARAAGLLPTYERCLEVQRGFHVPRSR
ncbi:dTDP-4-keto-6-deoxy-D-glucose epimerase [Actinoalloteichus sp. AHMU CJ021]|uniref:dTDP-4-dehydrorhamnose 3,5-epimerase family protein n=1 Tax=Actinoalloteichus TaxID=65496 RepID=UPI000379E3A7|nr:dTDP-4-dehydrorhamnose 3,5-epimerase family protein [Actinoalloteichus spitiensis]AUS77273.1 dTDP-4-keto-6-deoxy-D-glucose epimerase [Actinoalloteichus sp. AHMU CJ021]